MSDSTGGSIRWGIMGPGSIAKRFTAGLKETPGAVLAAVGSRDLGRAEAFAGEYGYLRSHGSYEALVNDPNVDVIYVAVPHNGHRDGCLLALQAGKPVLCEKPFTMNRREAVEVVTAARKHGKFLMEGMWTRCFPIMQKVRELLAENAIGAVRMVEADFGFRAGFNPSSRLFDPNLGGGALMDVGIYCLSFASMILGAPDKVAGFATLGETGVDEQAVMNLIYKNGALAMLSTAVRTNTTHAATIFGEDGKIEIHSPFWMCSSMTVHRSGKDAETFKMPFTASGFQFEAMEVQRCLNAGLLDSPVMPLDETLELMGTMDELRRQWGVRYPSDGND